MVGAEVATAEVVSLLGATPVFVDSAADLNMDAGALGRAVEAALAAELTPKIVIPVDIFGLPADYGSIRPVAEQFAMTIIDDAAQSFGATSSIS